jgi:hypothetical protein
MTRSNKNNALLANREVSICIDSSVLCGSLTLSLAPVRMSPTFQVLTSVVEQFAEEEIAPVVRAYLDSQDNLTENSPLYVPGSDVPRGIHRLVQIFIERPLMDEMERFVPTSQPKEVAAQKVEMLIRTSAVVRAPVFAPIQSHQQGHDSGILTSSKPAKDSKPRLPAVVQEVRIYSNYLGLWGG